MLNIKSLLNKWDIISQKKRKQRRRKLLTGMIPVPVLFFEHVPSAKVQGGRAGLPASIFCRAPPASFTSAGSA